MSGKKLILPNSKFCFDAFRNINKVGKIRSPTLVIHSKEDEVIPFDHGLKIYEMLQDPVDPLWLRGSHNGYTEDSRERYIYRLLRFINCELAGK